VQFAAPFLWEAFMTAADFDYISTRNQIIERAFRIVGALDLGNPLTAEQLAQGVQALQELTKAWQNEHLFLWTYNALSFSTVAAQVSYSGTLSTELIGIDKAWVVDGDSDLEVQVVPWSRYNEIRDKTLPGRPTIIAMQPGVTPTAYLWPVPDAIYTIRLSLIVKTLCFFKCINRFYCNKLHLRDWPRVLIVQICC